jgi:hypothetical protein
MAKAFLSFLLLFSVSVFGQSASDYQYYLKNQQVNLTAKPGQFFLHTKADFNEKDLLPRLKKDFGLEAISFAPVGGWKLIAKNPSTFSQKEFEKKLSLSSGIISAYPVLLFEGKELMTGNQFLVKPKPGQETTISRLTIGKATLLERHDHQLGSIVLIYQLNKGEDVFAFCRNLSETGLVEFAEPNFIFSGENIGFTPNDGSFGSQWFLNQSTDADIDAPEAWAITKGSSSVVVAVIDGNGYDMAHPDMAGKYFNAYDAVNDDNNPSPENADANHGTPCAGLVGAASNNTVGVASAGYNVSVMPIVLGFGASGLSFSTSLDIISRVAVRVTSTANVVATSNSYSFGSSAFAASVEASYTAMRNNSRGGLGAVNFCAYGNSNLLNPTVFPAGYATSFTVSAANRTDFRASFSNYGILAKISAHGENGIFTVDRSGADGYSSGDYANFSGTSAATPIVAGVAGLIGSLLPSANASLYEEILARSADKVGHTYSTTAGFPFGTRSNEMGYGRVNAYRAVLMAKNCLPQHITACSSGDFINTVQFGATSNANSGCNGLPMNYIFYGEDQFNFSAVLGSLTNLVVSNTTKAQVFGAWLDLNENGDFEANEFLGSSPSGNTGSFSINIGNDISQIGKKRLRIRSRASGSFLSSDACSGLPNGETEDYILQVVDAYCQPAVTNSCTTSGDFIQSFSFGGIVNSNTGCNGQSNNFFVQTNIPSQQLPLGSSQPISISCGPDFDQFMGVWIDYNNDGDFGDAGEFVFSGKALKLVSLTGNITIPTNAAFVGVRRLRVRSSFFDVPFSSTTSCSGVTYGETEDYFIRISNTVDFSGLAASYCRNFPGTVSLTGIPTGGIFSGPGIAGNTFTPSLLAPGTYNITYTFNGNTSTKSVIIRNIPLANISPGPQAEICPGSSVFLQASGGTVYSWSNGAITSGILVGTAGPFVVTVTDGFGCSARDTTTVILKTLPAKPVISPAGPIAICQGQSTTLTTNATGAHKWSTGATTSSISVSQTGVFADTAIGANGCTSVSDPVTVLVNPIPEVPALVARGPSTFCQGGNVRIGLANAPVQVTYKVDVRFYKLIRAIESGGIRIAGNFSSLGAPIPDWQPTDIASAMTKEPNSDIWTITVTYPRSAIGSTQLFKFVNTNWAPIGDNEATTNFDFFTQGCGQPDGFGNFNRVFTIPPVNTTMLFCWDQCSSCLGQATSGASLQWQLNGVDIAGQTDTSIIASSTGNYRLKISQNGCSGFSNAIPVTVNPIPSAPTISGASTRSVCFGSPVLLSVQNPVQGTVYLWSNGVTGNSISVETAGLFNVRAISNACTSQVSQSVNVIVNPLPVVFGGADFTVNQSSGNRFLGDGSPAGGTWSGQGVSTGSIFNTAQPSGSYPIVYCFTNQNGCTACDTLIANILLVPGRVDIPKITPGTGTYSSTQAVTITTSTPGSAIYFTTTGNNPVVGTSFTRLYTAPLQVSNTLTIRAMAVKTGMTNSGVAVANFNIPATSNPVISPGTGSYLGSQTVTITCPNPDAEIWYTASGNLPRFDIPNSFTKKYTGPFLINNSATIYAVAKAPNLQYSFNVVSVITIPPVRFSPPPGTYANAVSVTMTNFSSNAQMYYTTNGQVPVPGNAGTQLYTGPVFIPQSLTLRAISWKNGAQDGVVAVGNYIITNPAVVANPTFSPAPGICPSPCTVSINCATPDVQIYYTTNGNNPRTDIPNSFTRLYTGPIALGTSAVTIKAQGLKAGFISSSVVTGVFTPAVGRMAFDQNPDEQNGDWKMYPNPSQGIFVLTTTSNSPFGAEEVEIISPNGKLIERRILAEGVLEERFDLVNQPAGIYFLKLTGKDGKSFQRKIIRE